MTDPQAEQRKAVNHTRNAVLMDRLYRERRNGLRAIAARGGVAPGERDDVVHSAIAAVLQAYRGPDDTEALFRYTAVAVRNTVAKTYRRRARKESHLASMPRQQVNDIAGTSQEVAVIDLESSDPLELAIEHERSEAGSRALRELAPLERQILALGGAGYGNAEIAEIVGVSERSVRKRVTRARRRLNELKRIG